MYFRQCAEKKLNPIKQCPLYPQLTLSCPPVFELIFSSRHVTNVITKNLVFFLQYDATLYDVSDKCAHIHDTHKEKIVVIITLIIHYAICKRRCGNEQVRVVINK